MEADALFRQEKLSIIKRKDKFFPFNLGKILKYIEKIIKYMEKNWKNIKEE